MAEIAHVADPHPFQLKVEHGNRLSALIVLPDPHCVKRHAGDGGGPVKDLQAVDDGWVSPHAAQITVILLVDVADSDHVRRLVDRRVVAAATDRLTALSGPLGCLGVGAPFAIAAKLLHPDRPIFILQGDGSFGLNGFDYDTALRFKLPMVVVVGNDAAWGQIRLPQVQMFGEDKSPATLLWPTRYDKIVEAMGGYGEHVTDPKQIRPALERALQSNTVACVNVMLDPEAPAKSGMQGYAV